MNADLFGGQLRAMHDISHVQIDSDDPGVLINFPAPQLALVVLGLLLVGKAYPCLDAEREFLLARIDELIDFQTPGAEEDPDDYGDDD